MTLLQLEMYLHFIILPQIYTKKVGCVDESDVKVGIDKTYKKMHYYGVAKITELLKTKALGLEQKRI